MLRWFRNSPIYPRYVQHSARFESPSIKRTRGCCTSHSSAYINHSFSSRQLQLVLAVFAVVLIAPRQNHAPRQRFTRNHVTSPRRTRGISVRLPLHSRPLSHTQLVMQKYLYYYHGSLGRMYDFAKLRQST